MYRRTSTGSQAIFWACVAEIPRESPCHPCFASALLGLGDRPDLAGDFGLDAGALVDVDVGNAGVLSHIDIRQLAPETRSRRKRSSPTRRLVIVDCPHDVSPHRILPVWRKAPRQRDRHILRLKHPSPI